MSSSKVSTNGQFNTTPKYIISKEGAVIVLDIAKLNIACECVGLCMLLDVHKNYIMKVNCRFLLILLFCFLEQTTAEQKVCPSWFIPDNRSTIGLYCYLYSSEVMCIPDFLLLHFGYCMTYNNTTGTTEYDTLDTTILLTLMVSFIFSCLIMCP